MTPLVQHAAGTDVSCATKSYRKPSLLSNLWKVGVCRKYQLMFLKWDGDVKGRSSIGKSHGSASFLYLDYVLFH